MNWCRILGHKWNYYKDDVTHMIPNGIRYELNTEFRLCDRCYTNQMRHHYTGRDLDWYKFELSKEQLRDKKLKELGI